MNGDRDSSFSIARLLIATLVSCAWAFAFAFAYAFFQQRTIPLIISPLYPVVLAVMVALKTRFSLLRQGVRSRTAAITVGSFVGAFTLYVVWAVWIFALVREHGGEDVTLAGILLDPRRIGRVIAVLNEEGGTLVLFGSRPPRITLAFLWACEAAIVLVLTPWFTPRREEATSPTERPAPAPRAAPRARSFSADILRVSLYALGCGVGHACFLLCVPALLKLSALTALMCGAGLVEALTARLRAHRVRSRVTALAIALIVTAVAMVAWHVCVLTIESEGLQRLADEKPFLVFFVWVCWVAVVFVWPLCAAWQTAGEPFCEVCSSWCVERKGVAFVGPASDAREMRVRIEAKDFAYLESVGPRASDDDGWRIDVCSCPDCGETNTLAVVRVWMKPASFGAKVRSEKTWLKRVALTPREVEVLTAIGRSLAPGNRASASEGKRTCSP